MIPEWLHRTELLLGSDAMKKLQNSKVLIVGLGGVGSWASELIVRSGIGSITIVDSDNVDITNINRQLPALHSSIGKSKVAIMADRLMDINPDLNLTVIEKYINELTMKEVLSQEYDLVVDAIDTLSPKVWFLYFAIEKGCRIISCMGSGAKLDPTLIEVGDLDSTRNCPLARNVRKRLRRLGIEKGFTTVFSTEFPQKHAIVEHESQNKKSMIGTVAFVPAAFGCVIAAQVVKMLTEDVGKSSSAIS
ncbi:MAG: tRNA threonylcarbamoyladenosine dehydratase [Salinivirgaceae bacterium]|nr:tRNA threonylcarbamoyladenosine dehydratase [Salinivirgaceae bacterium]